MFIFQSNGYPQENFQTDVSAANTIGKSNMFDYRIYTDIWEPLEETQSLLGMMNGMAWYRCTGDVTSPSTSVHLPE